MRGEDNVDVEAVTIEPEDSCWTNGRCLLLVAPNSLAKAFVVIVATQWTK
jgi:hypothetical protein